jgi:hypothetical protein
LKTQGGIRGGRRRRTNYISTVCFLCSIYYKYICISYNVKIMLRKRLFLFSFVLLGLALLKSHYVPLPSSVCK